MAHKLLTLAGKGGLDAPMAAVAALAAGFAVQVMPLALFESAVAASGLPSLIAAAQPPLGQTARLAAAGAATLFVFLCVYALLRLAGRPARPRTEAPSVEAEEAAPVRRRRLDFHPDAPAREPLYAARDLGNPEPLPLVPDIEAPAPVADLPPEPEAPQPVAELATEPETPAPVPDRPPAPETYHPESITDLMARLERGIAARDARQRQAPSAVPVAPDTDAPVPSDSPIDERLRGAIESLHRFTARQQQG